MKARILGIVGALALAALGTALLASYVTNTDDRAESEDHVDVLVVAAPIEAGTAAGEIESSIQSQSVPASLQADDAVASLADVAGQVTTTDLVPGEQLLRSRFASPDELASNGSGFTNTAPDRVGYVVVPDGLHEVSFTISAERALGGQIRAGDELSFIASFTDDIGPGSVTSLLLHDLLVTSVQGAATTVDEDGEQTAAAGALTLTLAADAHQVERIVYSNEFGLVWVARSAENSTKNEALTYYPNVLLDIGGPVDWAELAERPVLSADSETSPDSAPQPAAAPIAPTEPTSDDEAALEIEEGE